MAAWCRLEATFRNHPKVRRLARVLDASRMEARGVLTSVWSWCLEYAPDGNLRDFDAVDLAEGIDWEGDPQVLWDGLVEVGLLDKTEDGDPEVHEFFERNDQLRDALRKREERARKKKERPGPSGTRPARVRKNPLDGTGRDETGRDETHTPNPPPARVSLSEPPEVEAALAYWRARRPEDKKAGSFADRDAVKKRLAEGYTLEELRLAIDGIFADPWEGRHAARSFRHCLGDRADVAKWIAYGREGPPKPKPKASWLDVFEGDKPPKPRVVEAERPLLGEGGGS